MAHTYFAVIGCGVGSSVHVYRGPLWWNSAVLGLEVRVH